MKKTLLLFIAITLIAGFAMAYDEDEDDDWDDWEDDEDMDFDMDEDEGIGFTVGTDFSIDGVNKPNGEDMSPNLMPYIVFERSFLDGVLYLYTELDYTIGLTKDDGEIPNELFFLISLSYNLNLGESSILTFSLENENGFVFLPKDEVDFKDRIYGTLKPGIAFNQYIERFGNLYAQVDALVKYAQGWGETVIPIGLDFSAGWKSTFGLGLKAKVHTLLAPKDIKEGYTGLDISVSYGNGPISAGVEARIASEKDKTSSFFGGSKTKSGIAIAPSFEYTFDFGFSVSASCAFGGIGGNGDITISPSLGVAYSF